MPLTDIAVRSAKPGPAPYKLADGHGLHLLVTPSGSKLWRLRYRRNGRESMLGLGAYPRVGLKDARIAAENARAALAEGTDPVVEKRRQRARDVVLSGNTFAHAVEAYLKGRTGWASGHRKRFEQRMRGDVLPVIGSIPIDRIAALDVVSAVQPIIDRGAMDSAKRTVGMIGQVMAKAVVLGLARSNPTVGLAAALGDAPPVRSRAAILDPDALGVFLRTLWQHPHESAAKELLKTILLTFARPGEVRGMRWDQIDMARREWTYTVSKVALRDHIVPLSRQALAIIDGMRPLTGRHPFVFASPTTGLPLSDPIPTVMISRLGVDRSVMTAHGARAIARTHLVERLGFPEAQVEMQLSHAPKDIHGTAYNRTQWRAERHAMMQAYADHLDGLQFTHSASQRRITVHLDNAAEPVETPRREINFDPLSKVPAFDIDPADRIETYEVSELALYSVGGGFAKFERRGDGESIYGFIERRFGSASPLAAQGWKIVAATLRIVRNPPDDQGRKKTLTIDLKSPNRTTLRNKTEDDRIFVTGLLTRWGVFTPPNDGRLLVEPDQLSAVSLLSEMLELRTDKLPTDAYSNRPGFPALRKCLIIRDAGLLQSVRCEECEQTHDAPVTYHDGESAYGWICYEHGFFPIERERLAAFRVSIEAIVTRLSASLACRNRRERPLIDGLLWRVGTFDWANQDVAVYLATRIATLDEAQRCAAAISAEPRAGFRVLLTPDLDNMRDFEIAGCAIAKLSDAISIDPVLGLEARPYRVARLAGGPVQGSGGRPAVYEPMLSELIETRDRDGVAAPGLIAEVRAIHAIWPTLALTERTPSEGTVRRALSKYRGGS